MSGWRPLAPVRGYLPIEDHGLIGDGRGAALVGRDGGVSWMCAPRFDSPPVFCGLLDRHRGGAFRISPQQVHQSRQYYLEDTGVLVTELQTDTGVLEVTDAFPLEPGIGEVRTGHLPPGSGELLRCLRVLTGEVECEVAVEPRGHVEDEVEVRRLDQQWRIRAPAWPDATLRLTATRPLTGLRSVWRLRAGQREYVSLGWHGQAEGIRPDPPERMETTVRSWRRWMSRLHYEGPQPAMVRRAAVTLKLLDHADNGAIVAAPTSSLPEAIGGERNWDYRFTWIRDAAFSVYALRRVGLAAEAETFLDWVLRMVDRHGEPRVLYDLDGYLPAEEVRDRLLEGYRGSQPVRWGNAAVDQAQHDVYGEILDCAYQRVAGGGQLDPPLWSWLRRLADTASVRWHQPDRGIWEVRSSSRRFTYSVALCQVALDRAARMAQRLDLPGDVAGWQEQARQAREAVVEQAWDPEIGAFTESLPEPVPDPGGRQRPPLAAGRGLDASVLALPLRRVVPSVHPRMVATTRVVARRLDAGAGLLYRYLPEVSPDGLPGHEGAFLLCSFWLVDNLARQAELDPAALDQAEELFASLCARANPLGLLPEQIDPTTGAFLGNFPQAFSHVGVIGSGINLARARTRAATAIRPDTEGIRP